MGIQRGYLGAGFGGFTLVRLGIKASESLASLDRIAFVAENLGELARDAETEVDFADIDIAVELQLVAVGFWPASFNGPAGQTD